MVAPSINKVILHCTLPRVTSWDMGSHIIVIHKTVIYFSWKWKKNQVHFFPPAKNRILKIWPLHILFQKPILAFGSRKLTRFVFPLNNCFLISCINKIPNYLFSLHLIVISIANYCIPSLTHILWVTKNKQEIISFTCQIMKLNQAQTSKFME